MGNLKDNIEHAFRKHRVVFWYDDGNNNEEEFDQLALTDIEKVKVNGNEFALKYRILREEKEQRFLLYFPYAKPANEENWLLDIELSNKLYESDEASIFLQEMAWEYRYKSFIEEHVEFFKAKSRRQKLASIYNHNDSFEKLKLKMVAFVFGTDNYDLLSLIQVYANSFIAGNIDKYEAELDRYNLKDFLWKSIQEKYSYKDDRQEIFRFIMEVFINNFALKDEEKIKRENRQIHVDSRLILSKWRDSITLKESFIAVSDKIADIIHVESLLQNATIDQIEEDELFRITDIKILSVLAKEVSESTISAERLESIIKSRENKFWYNEYKHLYKSIEYGYKLLNKVKETAFNFDNIEKAIQTYTDDLYKVDYYYRKFYYHYQNSGRPNILKALFSKVEKVYVNDWLFNKGNNYQQLLNKKKQWEFENLPMQRHFFRDTVGPIIDKQKLFVIISDAFRYECGVELNETINKMNKFNSDLNYMISSLPSYTQLGMASLLPNEVITFDGLSDNIKIDGLSTSGTANRAKVLSQIKDKRSNAIQAADFVKMSSGEKSNFVRDHDLVYIYHNQIDKQGDDKMTENMTIQAVQKEVDYLVELIKSLTSANASRVLVTADHGFIFQAETVNENDFLDIDYTGDTFKNNRRFVLGENLMEGESTMKFKAKDLGIDSEIDVLIPKNINRFRVKGAGSQFIHGGATLQETIIPLLDITKGRKDDIRYVDVNIVQASNEITTNFLPVIFYQNEAVTDKFLARQIQAYIQAEDGEILSDTFTFNFDFTEEEKVNRQHQHNFQMDSKAGEKYQNKTVKLVLRIQVEGTSIWQEYKSYSYIIRTSFTTDFDF